MTRGRKPLPPHLKLLRATDKGRPLPAGGPAAEGPVERPAFLKGHEIEIWDATAPRLIECGLLTSLDAHMLAVWVQLAALSEEQMLPVGYLTQLRGIASILGLEPTSRARMGVKADAATVDPAESYFDPPGEK